MEKEDIEKEGIKLQIPTRKEETGRKISVAYLTKKQNDQKWNHGRAAGCRQRKRMLALAITQAIRVCLENHSYKIGDKVYLQKEGGPIGLELTGAVSRAVMASWDKKYLKRVKQAGIKMLLYERYVDDSNQVAEVPDINQKYDKTRKILVKDKETENIEGVENRKEDDQRLAEILKEIADDVMPCIKMEADWPTKNEDGKLPILDMKVWLSGKGEILYQHYEKPMASKTVLHSKSAHPQHCKKSVHVQEIIRRLVNCSRKLDWESDTAPVISEYMLRMKLAGYGEKYRENIARKAINIYKKKIEDEERGIRPLFRPKFWRREARKKEKERKKKEWGTKKGHIAPIFVPTTPGGELAKKMRNIAHKRSEDGIHFNIVEVGGRTMKSELQRSNPTESKGCNKDDCLGCYYERGKGGKCHKNNINYVVECQVCKEEEKAIYYGETARNLYTRMIEHQRKYKDEREKEESEDDGFMKKHMKEYHSGEEGRFKAKVTHHNRDSLSRQIREGVQIRRTNKPLMNTKSEWFQPPLFRVQSEVIHE